MDPVSGLCRGCMRTIEEIGGWMDFSNPEKLAVLKTADYFSKRAARADFRAFDRLMRRRGGEAPQPGDEMPENYHKNKKKSRRR